MKNGPRLTSLLLSVLIHGQKIRQMLYIVVINVCLNQDNHFAIIRLIWRTGLGRRPSKYTELSRLYTNCLYTVPARLTFTVLSYPIVRVSYPIVRFAYRIVRVSYRENRLSGFAFILYQVLRLSGFAFIVYQVLRLSGFPFKVSIGIPRHFMNK